MLILCLFDFSALSLSFQGETPCQNVRMCWIFHDSCTSPMKTQDLEQSLLLNCFAKNMLNLCLISINFLLLPFHWYGPLDLSIALISQADKVFATQFWQTEYDRQWSLSGTPLFGTWVMPWQKSFYDCHTYTGPKRCVATCFILVWSLFSSIVGHRKLKQHT